ncbi:MAG TPA: tRNA (adenosine(37)-N6)-threonylcarbamoyltransferase complex dimerization subunit type 1 TsaB [Bacteroidetes bacterium]|nr:tRNA (adenosine(37)-N6)-threonylcarbamoyltransferase complex dimerization subunit type 1 TsaB [Bacteroidota bacterium]HRK04358.1 tRNA (adenosine(37)-N6)-threonylcarbamoyltransferase complex dimerization subunit type 1 TsaB [Chlorobiota bacterium]
MTTILAIETTGLTCGVTIATRESDRVSLLSVVDVLRQNIHDEVLSVIVQDALRLADVTLSSVDVVAVSAGPGSFTGTRIGMSYALGLTQELPGSPHHIRHVNVSTSHALALVSREVCVASGMMEILVAIPSHKDLLWVQRFTPNGDPVEDVQTKTIEQTKPLCSPFTMVVGPGASHLTARPISGLTRLSSRFIAVACALLDENGDGGPMLG